MHDEEETPTINLGWIKDLFPLAMLVVSGLIWGMKLEGRADRAEDRTVALQAQVTAIQTEINRGILPITQEKVAVLDRRMTKLEQDCVEKHQ